MIDIEEPKVTETIERRGPIEMKHIVSIQTEQPKINRMEHSIVFEQDSTIKRQDILTIEQSGPEQQHQKA